MKILEKLIHEKIFNSSLINQLVDSAEDEQGVRDLMKSGQIVKVTGELFCAVDPETNRPAASKFEIGSAINDGAYISGISALEYHGVLKRKLPIVKIYLSLD